MKIGLTTTATRAVTAETTDAITGGSIASLYLQDGGVVKSLALDQKGRSLPFETIQEKDETDPMRGHNSVNPFYPGPIEMIGRVRLQQFAKLLDRKPGITNKTTHRECVDGIVARNGKDPPTVSHHDVLALTRDPESSLFEGAYRIKVIYPGNLGQVLHRYLDFSNLFTLKLLFDD